MKKTSLLLLLALTVYACDRSDLFIEPDQEISEAIIEVAEANSLDEVFSVVEEQPTYPGGMTEWYKHLSETLKYPKKAKAEGVEGAVYLSFVVDKTGELRDMQVVRGIGAGCDEEALRVLLESKDWIPGKQGGKEVSAKMQVRISFKLSEGSEGPSTLSHETKEVITETLDNQSN